MIVDGHRECVNVCAMERTAFTVPGAGHEDASDRDLFTVTESVKNRVELGSALSRPLLSFVKHNSFRGLGIHIPFMRKHLPKLKRTV